VHYGPTNESTVHLFLFRERTSVRARASRGAAHIEDCFSTIREAAEAIRLPARARDNQEPPCRPEVASAFRGKFAWRVHPYVYDAADRREKRITTRGIGQPDTRYIIMHSSHCRPLFPRRVGAAALATIDSSPGTSRQGKLAETLPELAAPQRVYANLPRFLSFLLSAKRCLPLPLPPPLPPPPRKVSRAAVRFACHVTTTRRTMRADAQTM